MLAVLTIATVFIAVVLAVVHWKTVREVLLWIAAIVNVLSLLVGLLALLCVVIVFLWTAFAQNTELVPVGIALLVAVAVLGVVCVALSAIEEQDREKQFARFRAWSLAQFNRTKRDAIKAPDEDA